MLLADFPVPQPGYTDRWLGALLAVVVGVVCVGGPLVVAEVRRGRAHRAELAGRAERERAKLAAATVPLVVERRATDAAETTGVITMPPTLFRSGRHAAPSLVGAARVPLDMGHRFAAAMRPGWWKA